MGVRNVTRSSRRLTGDTEALERATPSNSSHSHITEPRVSTMKVGILDDTQIPIGRHRRGCTRRGHEISTFSPLPSNPNEEKDSCISSASTSNAPKPRVHTPTCVTFKDQNDSNPEIIATVYGSGYISFPPYQKSDSNSTSSKKPIIESGYTHITRAVRLVASGFHTIGALYTQDVRKWGSEYEPSIHSSGRSQSINDSGYSTLRSSPLSSAPLCSERDETHCIRGKKEHAGSHIASTPSNPQLGTPTAKSSSQRAKTDIEQEINQNQAQAQIKRKAQESYFPPMAKDRLIFHAAERAQQGALNREANLNSVRELERAREWQGQRDEDELLMGIPWSGLDALLESQEKIDGYKDVDSGIGCRYSRAEASTFGGRAGNRASNRKRNGNGRRGGIANRDGNVDGETDRGNRGAREDQRHNRGFGRQRHQGPYQEQAEDYCDGLDGCKGEMCIQHRICAIEGMAMSDF